MKNRMDDLRSVDVIAIPCNW